jgi:hypothetical protein
LKNFLVDLKSNNIYFIPLELFQGNACPDLLTFHPSLSSGAGYPDNLDLSQKSSNPGIPDPSSGSGQPGNSGSNSGDGEPVPDFANERRKVGSKLRDLFVHKPFRGRVLMTHADYSNRINV